MNLKSFFCLTILLLLCCSCVSRTISEPVGPDEDGRATVKETKLIWIWDKEFNNP